MRRLEAWLARLGEAETPTIICSECEKRVPLWDDLELCFASPEMQQRVRELQEQSALVLDSESKERALVGEVISTAALAGQISREFSVNDHGIDMEIQFRDDDGKATRENLYLVLKSGDTHNETDIRYWIAQEFPVMLVIHTSEGEVRWMEVRDWLRRASYKHQKPRRQIIFEGERFDVMSVRRWRDRMSRKGWLA
jgi:hypothetical protein